MMMMILMFEVFPLGEEKKREKKKIRIMKDEIKKRKSIIHGMYITDTKIQ